MSNPSLMIRGVAQLVSVRVWGACGRWFESSHPDITTKALNIAVIFGAFCVLPRAKHGCRQKKVAGGVKQKGASVV